MPPVPDKFDFSSLSVAERILLVEQLWDSIAQDTQANDMPLTEEQKQELDRRLAADEAGEEKYFSWPEVKRWLLTEK